MGCGVVPCNLQERPLFSFMCLLHVGCSCHTIYFRIFNFDAGAFRAVDFVYTYVLVIKPLMPMAYRMFDFYRRYAQGGSCFMGDCYMTHDP